MKIAIGGSAANPVHFGHRYLLEYVISLQRFDLVQWIISGDRPDKPGLPPSIERWRVAQLMMSGLPVEISYDPGKATPTIEAIRRAQRNFPDAHITWYCGLDHFVVREKFNGLCDVEAFWHEGDYLMEEQEFLIFMRKGLEYALMHYPKKYTLVDCDIPDISSTKIRRRIIQGLDIAAYTSSDVAKCIAQKKLYL